MEITGRLTANATVKTVSDDRQVVNFTLVQNDSYKKSDGEKVSVATFFDCSYWISTKVAAKLTKGTIVSLYGRLGVNAWTSMNGEAKATLTFHTNNIRFIGATGSAAASEAAPTAQPSAPAPSPETKDDMPF